MGMTPLRQGSSFVIASDCNPHEPSTARAPKKKLTATHTWTGIAWSTEPGDAKTFASAEEADEYLRSHNVELNAGKSAKPTAR